MCPPKLLCLADVRFVALFRASEKQMNLRPFLSEINPVAGAEIQPQHRDALANLFHIAEKSILKPINADADSRSGLNIEVIEPFGERFSSGFVPANEDFSWSGFQRCSRATAQCDI